ncbi:tumor necrosis factor receptor superfamily member 10B-like [Tenrec ecaudatus]|uniref:tumor necrosis factor receptor superfamily member 10B-like n=1 Tax=Tenrec ecaudatus TaxID=94439 RepID=UPI003F5AD6E4
MAVSSHASQFINHCVACKYGETFTSAINNLHYCLRCSVCKPDQVEISPCIPTRDRECACKPGMFHDKDDPETCHKCSPGCPEGMVEDSPCTPKSDRKCIQESPTETEIAPERYSNTGTLLPVLLPVLLMSVACFCWNGRSKVLALISRVMNRCPSKGPTSGNNAHNEALNSKLDPELEIEGKKQTEVASALDEILVEGEPLLGPPQAEEPPLRRLLLVPVNGANPTETLESFFDFIAREVPVHSWNAVMQHMGLTDNEIHVARSSARCPEKQPYNLLQKWLRKAGKEASVNSLLAALDAQGEGDACGRIQRHLVASGKYTCEPASPLGESGGVQWV